MKKVIYMAAECMLFEELGPDEFEAALFKFAELVRSDEREACAKLCDAQNNKVVVRHPARVEFNPDSMMAKKCAAAIRARGETK